MIQDYSLEPLRKICFNLKKNTGQRWYSQTHLYRTSDDAPGKIIYDVLMNEKPAMITRFGTSELHIILNYLSRNKPLYTKLRDYLLGYYPEFWWGKYAKNDIYQNSGFFSNDEDNLEKFAQLYLRAIPNIDILLTWLVGEKHLKQHFNHKFLKTYLYDCEPYFETDFPWTQALENKKVLVIHPFEESIKFQYQKRRLLFTDQRVLPDFELSTIKSLQTIKGNQIFFDNWFEALEQMKEKIDEKDFDIALIAAGAYGLPLSAHVKSLGKKGVHLGGFLQQMFGIRGRRWDGCAFHSPFVNEHWKYPYESEYPKSYEKLDRGSYWK